MKLQTVQHADGSLEIQRKLSLDWLENCQDGDPLLYESSIVWLEDIATLPYVREMTAPKCKSRRGPRDQPTFPPVAGIQCSRVSNNATAPPPWRQRRLGVAGSRRRSVAWPSFIHRTRPICVT